MSHPGTRPTRHRVEASEIPHQPTLTTSATARTGRLDSPYFKAKFKTPGAPRHRVCRDRLVTLLDDLSEFPITVVTAPAGAGKTALAAEWARSSDQSCAWLSLDESDQEPAQLRHSLASALDLLLPGCGTALVGDLDAGSAEGCDELARRRLRARPGRMTLIIDNLDRIDDDPRARATLASFVEHLPAPVHLLLLGRRPAPLPLDRLRAAGDLADIHFPALRFTDDEAATLLTTRCPALAVDELAIAVRWADGWAAALQLTALAIRSHRYTGGADVEWQRIGADRLVDHYLWEEVLGSEDPELITLLLAIAVAGRVNVALAEAVTERSDAGDLLDAAEDRGLFVTTLDDGWYELHGLVREVLISRFERRWPAALREQHARAAEWFESVGDERSALEHWLQAGRTDQALRVLADLAPRLLETGRSRVLTRALGHLPPGIAATEPDQAIRYAWCQLLGGHDGAAETLAIARSTCSHVGQAARGRLDVVRSAAGSLTGDWEGAGALAQAALETLPDHGWTEPLGRFGWRLVAQSVAFGERWDDAAPLVDAARTALSNAVDARWAFEGARAVGLSLAGDPVEAQRVVAAARQAVAGTLHHTTLQAELVLADLIAAAEVGDRQQAHAGLARLAAQPLHPVPVLQVLAQIELVRLWLSTGQLDAAVKGFDDAQALCGNLFRADWRDRADPAGDLPAPSVRSTLARMGVVLALATDDVEAATRWYRQVLDDFWGPACEAKLQLALGHVADANEALRGAVPRCPRHEVVRDLLRARVLARSDRDAASLHIVHALETAQRRGMLQTVASEGVEVLDLVELAAWCVPAGWMDRLRHAMLPTWAGRDVAGPIEALTDREREVLRLLPSRLTLREIASELYVSQNTLKFHLRAIYRKLGVASRASAVALARERRLLPHG